MSEHYKEPGFNPGAVVDTIDHRDFKWNEIAAALPPFDWNKGYNALGMVRAALNDPNWKLKIKDQDGSGSCGGQAWSYQAEILRSIFKKMAGDRSSKFLYSQTFVPGGGSSGRTNSDLFVNKGISSEVLCPSYDKGMPPSEAFMERVADITQEAREDAKTTEALNYATVAGTMDDYAQAIEANHGAIFLIRGSNNGSWGSKHPIPPKAGEELWAHWICGLIATLENGKKLIKFPNSWGEDVGDAGWQELGEEWFVPQPGIGTPVFYAWTHVFNVNPVTTFHHRFEVNMHFGETSGEVTALQSALQADGSFPAGIKPTGFYGSITAQSVLKFQQKYNISNSSSPYGRDVGPNTRAKLNELFGQ